jgi:hypothetical protein
MIQYECSKCKNLKINLLNKKIKSLKISGMRVE